MSTKDSINQLVKNITGDDVNTQRITEGLKELIIALDGGDKIKPTDDTISELIEVVAEVLPDKLGITPTGTLKITDNGEYDVTEYAGANVEVEKGVVLDQAFYGGETLFVISTQWDNHMTVTIPDRFTTISNEVAKQALAFDKVVFGENVTTIENGADRDTFIVGAFQDCFNLKVVIFNERLTTIGDYAFFFRHENYFPLKVVIPTSVTTIGDYCFYLANYGGMTSSQRVEVYYKGTQEQWNAITKGTHSFNYCNMNYEYTGDGSEF